MKRPAQSRKGQVGAIAPRRKAAYRELMGRAPNEIPGRPVSSLVPSLSDNENVAAKADRRRAAVAWRKLHPSRLSRLFRRRSVPLD